MPIAVPPARGYADYQRVTNADSGVLFGLSNTLIPAGAGLSSGNFDVGRYQYLGAQISIATHPLLMVLQWGSDALGNIPLGNRSYVLSPLVGGGTMQLRVANLGSFVNVLLKQVDGVAPTVNCNFIGTNRYSPLEVLPVNPTIHDVQGAAIGAGATVDNYPNDYYAGPLHVWYQISTSNGSAQLMALTQANTWETIDQVQVAVGNTDWNTVTPPGAWRIRTFNGGAAGTYFLGAASPITGSL